MANFEDIQRREKYADEFFQDSYQKSFLTILRRRTNVQKVIDQYGGLDLMPLSIRDKTNQELADIHTFEIMIQAAVNKGAIKDERIGYQSELICRKATLHRITEMEAVAKSFDFSAKLNNLVL